MPSLSFLPQSTCSNEEVFYSDDYAEYIVKYFNNVENALKRFDAVCYQTLDSVNMIVYEGPIDGGVFGVEKYGYSVFPKCYGLVDLSALEETGVLRMRRIPALELYGRDILIGFVDTGIEYTHPVFINADKTSRIHSIWDQSIRGGGNEVQGFLYGTEYLREDINRALAADNPLEFVPTTDEIGHGTFMAGVAAGNDMPNQDFSGIAPQADVIMVKLKEAKPRYREYYRIPEGVPCYQENDIMSGIAYILRKAVLLNKNVVICIGVGTNSGGHEGLDNMDRYINFAAEDLGVTIVTAAGNETGSRGHFKGDVLQSNNYEDVEINVGTNDIGFTAELWVKNPGVFSVGLLTPSGEFSGKISARLNENREINFLLERSRIFVHYSIIEYRSGDQLVFMRFINPDPGIWTIRVYNDSDFGMDYHIWLAVRQFMGRDTYFTSPNPDTTICGPGNTLNVLTIAGYNVSNGSIYANSSRGYTRYGRVKPDLAAPAVNVYGPLNGGRFGTMSGTCVGAAITSGIATLLNEWLNSQGIPVNGIRLKNYMIKGARRDNNITYRSRDWRTFGEVHESVCQC